MAEPYSTLVASLSDRIAENDAQGVVRLGMGLGSAGPDGYLWLWAVGEAHGEPDLVRLSAYFCATAPEDHWGIALLAFGFLSNSQANGEDCPDRVNTQINLCTILQAIALEEGFSLVAPFAAWFLIDLLYSGQPEPARSAFETLDLLARYEVLPSTAASEGAIALHDALQQFDPLDEDEKQRKDDVLALLTQLSQSEPIKEFMPAISDVVCSHVATLENSAPERLRGPLAHLLLDAQRYLDSHNLAVQWDGHVLEGRLSWLPDFNPLPSFHKFISALESMMSTGQILSTTTATGSLVIRVCGIAPPRGLNELAAAPESQDLHSVADVLKKTVPLLAEVAGENVEVNIRSASPTGSTRPLRWAPKPERARYIVTQSSEDSVQIENTRILVELVAADCQSGRATILQVREGAERASAKAQSVQLLRGRTIGQRYWITAEMRTKISITHGERIEYLISDMSRPEQADQNVGPRHVEVHMAARQIPQSVKLKRLVTWLRLIATEGRLVSATEIGLQAERSTDYYRRGAEALELLTRDGDLTMAGRLVASTNSDEEALVRMAECFAESQLARLLMEFAEVDTIHGVTMNHTRPFVESLASDHLQQTTIESRAGTLRSWLRAFQRRLASES